MPIRGMEKLLTGRDRPPSSPRGWGWGLTSPPSYPPPFPQDQPPLSRKGALFSHQASTRSGHPKPGLLPGTP